jgi:catalase
MKMKTILLAILMLTVFVGFSQKTAKVSKNVAAQTPEEVRDSLFTNIKLANVPRWRTFVMCAFLSNHSINFIPSDLNSISFCL